MPIAVSLFQKVIGGRTFAFDTGDIAFGDAETKEILKNTGIDVVKIPLKKRQVTFTIRGAVAADVDALYAQRDDTIIQLLNATGVVTGENIAIGGDVIYNCLLKEVTANAPITVAGIPVIEQVQVKYDSQVYV